MAEHKMKRHTKVVLITIIGIAVLGAVAFHVFKGGYDVRSQRVISYVEKELNLDPAQVALLQSLKTEMDGVRIKLRNDAEAGMNEFADIVTASEFDPEQMTAFIDEQTLRFNQAANELVPAMTRFADSLDTGQRALLREKIASHRHGWRRWHGWRD